MVLTQGKLVSEIRDGEELLISEIPIEARDDYTDENHGSRRFAAEFSSSKILRTTPFAITR